MVKYSEFGAKGDGVTNDFDAIARTHEYANGRGEAVCADAGATYYIGRTGGKSAVIKTDTDWTGATFVIDDTSFDVSETSERGAHIFCVSADCAMREYRAADGETGAKIEQINSHGGIPCGGVGNIGIAPGYPALVYLINDGHKVYIRHGANENSGNAQRELLLVDAQGNVSEDTPVLIAYDGITRIQVQRIDDAPITVRGGTFITRANAAPRKYTYYARGIQVKRSNTVVKDITHRIEGEGENGAPYNGFIATVCCNAVTIKDCSLQAHRAYKLEGADNNVMGSYDIVADNSNNLTWQNVTQVNFFLPDGKTPSVNHGYWGIMGSNYCKNLVYRGCKLTRFDAHCGTYNATIVDSEVGTLTLIGGGLFRFENSKIYTAEANYVVYLRGDYGSTWHGDVVIKDVECITADNFSRDVFNLFVAHWVNHNFGYPCYMPTTVAVDNLKISAPSVKKVLLAYVSPEDVDGMDGAAVGGEVNNNPYKMTEVLKVSGNSCGYDFALPQRGQFSSVKIEFC